MKVANYLINDDEVNRITNACNTFWEKFVIRTFLDTGLRLSEFANLTKDNIQWQGKRIVVYGKGGPYGKNSKRRTLPMIERVRRLLEYHFAENNTTGLNKRTIERIVKKVANKAGISKPVSPHVLRHTFSVTGIKKSPTPEPSKQIDNELLHENDDIKDCLFMIAEQKLFSNFHINHKKIPIVHL